MYFTSFSSFLPELGTGDIAVVIADFVVVVYVDCKAVAVVEAAIVVVVVVVVVHKHTVDFVPKKTFLFYVEKQL